MSVFLAILLISKQGRISEVGCKFLKKILIDEFGSHSEFVKNSLSKKLIKLC